MWLGQDFTGAAQAGLCYVEAVQEHACGRATHALITTWPHFSLTWPTLFLPPLLQAIPAG